MGTKKPRRALRVYNTVDGVLQRSRILTGRKKLQARYEFQMESVVAQDGISTSEIYSPNDWEDVDDMDPFSRDVEMVMTGMEEAPLSHTGDEIRELLYAQLQRERSSSGTHQKHTRDRRDRILKRNEAFSQQLSSMTESYLHWSASKTRDKYWDLVDFSGVAESLGEGEVEGEYELTVVDLYDLAQSCIPLTKSDNGIAAALVKNGLVPCAPCTPHLAVTIRTLESFRLLSLNCPRLAIQSFVKTICGQHLQPYRPHLQKQFSICVDVYLSILAEAELLVNKALSRDSPHWRLEHVCPPCTYVLQDEQPLKFKMLITMDGNNSLKRIPKRQRLPEFSEAANGNIEVTHIVTDVEDQRTVAGDYYIPRKTVEHWADDLKKKKIGDVNGVGQEESDSLGTSLQRKGKEKSSEGIPENKENENNNEPCSERWKNMSEKRTATSWSIFDETGIFVSLCRHGFVLTLADMVKSGEGSQYALATIEQILKTFGSNIGGGYDIGCRMKKTIARSSLNSLAEELNYTSLVGSFHGHAHNRLCQLDYLATYVEGLGLSDLEGAERLFSRTNDLATSTRHSSVFHRQQKIVQFIKHLDETDTYENLSKILIGNYTRALDLLDDTPAFEKAKGDLNIGDNKMFECWLAEEKAYLTSRLKEPEDDKNEIDYLETLKKLNQIRKTLHSSEDWFIHTPSTNIQTASETAKLETNRRHNKETEAMLLKRVHELELKLNIRRSWQEGDDDWERVSDLIVHRDYRLCLEKLEGLVVQRIFELGKMNQAGTGYNLRQHIANALQTRCAAIRKALASFNDAGASLSPPRPRLKWEEVMEYTFLAEFDLLADSRQDIRQRVWARPAARALMDKFFKISRAREEVERLNIEIPRFTTFIRDEEAFLAQMEHQFQDSHPLIAHQICLRRSRFSLANKQHITRLQEFIKKYNLPLSLSRGAAINPIGGHLQLPLTPNHGRSPSPTLSHDVTIQEASLVTQAEMEAEEEVQADEAESQLQEDLEVIIVISDPLLEVE